VDEENKDLKEDKVHKEKRVHKELKEKRVHKAHKEKRVHKVTLELKVLKEKPETLEQLDSSIFAAFTSSAYKIPIPFLATTTRKLLEEELTAVMEQLPHLVLRETFLGPQPAPLVTATTPLTTLATKTLQLPSTPSAFMELWETALPITSPNL